VGVSSLARPRAQPAPDKADNYTYRPTSSAVRDGLTPSTAGSTSHSSIDAAQAQLMREHLR